MIDVIIPPRWDEIRHVISENMFNSSRRIKAKAVELYAVKTITIAYEMDAH